MSISIDKSRNKIHVCNDKKNLRLQKIRSDNIYVQVDRNQNRLQFRLACLFDAFANLFKSKQQTIMFIISSQNLRTN